MSKEYEILSGLGWRWFGIEYREDATICQIHYFASGWSAETWEQETPEVEGHRRKAIECPPVR